MNISSVQSDGLGWPRSVGRLCSEPQSGLGSNWDSILQSHSPNLYSKTLTHVKQLSSVSPLTALKIIQKVTQAICKFIKIHIKMAFLLWMFTLRCCDKPVKALLWLSGPVGQAWEKQSRSQAGAWCALVSGREFGRRWAATDHCRWWQDCC